MAHPADDRPLGRRHGRPQHLQRPHDGKPLVLVVLAVLALGCACVSWRLGHHVVVGGGGGFQDELAGTWLAQSLRMAAAVSGETDVPAEDRVVIHFSTDCTSFQHWQALALLESAVRVGQRGAIVRAVSGCEKESSLTGEDQLSVERVRADHEAFLRGQEGNLPFRFHLLFIDDMTTIGSGEKQARYKFANKAQSLHYWLDELRGGTLQDVVAPGTPGADEDHDVAVVSIDPDFLFLKRFGPRELGLYDDDDDDGRLDSAALEAMSGRDLLRRMRGKPVAQSYGLGYGWLGFNLTEICGPGSNCLKVDGAEADRHYNMGPPYAMHRDDWLALIDVWVEMIPQVYDAYPTVPGPNKDPTRHYAEMYAVAMAAAHLELAHKLLANEMLGCMVHYPREVMLGAARDMGLDPAAFRCGVDSVVGRSRKLPAFVHYCQRHAVANREGREWLFFKRMVPHDLITDCGPHLLELPPADAMGDMGREDPFVVCTLTEVINASKRRFRAAACRGNSSTTTSSSDSDEEKKEVFDVQLITGAGWRKIGRGELDAVEKGEGQDQG